jgi:hypothetical protein
VLLLKESNQLATLLLFRFLVRDLLHASVPEATRLGRSVILRAAIGGEGNGTRRRGGRLSHDCSRDAMVLDRPRWRELDAPVLAVANTEWLLAPILVRVAAIRLRVLLRKDASHCNDFLRNLTMRGVVKGFLFGLGLTSRCSIVAVAVGALVVRVKGEGFII